MNEINFNVEDIEKIDLSMDVGIKEIYPPLENLTVEPTKEQQVFTHENSYGYDEVVVNAIPDEYIIPDGILEVTENGDVDVTMYKKARVGVYTPPTLQDKEVTPTKEIQTITSDESYDGLNQVTVNAIPDEYIVPNGSLDITRNGTYDIKQYAEAKVNVAGSGEIKLQDKTITITENGTHNITFDEGYNGLSNVNLVIDVKQSVLLVESTFAGSNKIADMRQGVAPCPVTFGFDTTTRTSKLSNTTITKIRLNLPQNGKLTIGKVNLNEFRTGVLTPLETKQYNVVVGFNDIYIDNLVLGQNETILLGAIGDASFYFKDTDTQSLSIDGKLMTESYFNTDIKQAIVIEMSVYGYNN